jgi:hypothetical protein
VAMMLLALACNDDMDIHTRYLFDLETMPVQKKIIEGETAEIRCQLVKEGNYQDAKFYIRMFQSDGIGELRMDDGTVFKPNDLYPLKKETFRLYYTSHCTDQQSFDVCIEDNFGQTVQKTFSFANEKAPEEKPAESIDYSFAFTSLPVPSQILLNDTIEIKCQLVKADGRTDANYSIRYFQPNGKGKLLLGNNVLMQPNELYELNSEDFKLYYVSDSEERQSVDVYIIDSRRQTVQKSFVFENIPIEQEPEIDISFELITMPVPKKIASGETVEIRCQIKKADERNTSSYSIRYFQSDGSEQQTIGIYIEDEHGQVVQKTFSWQSEDTGNKDENDPADINSLGE